MFSYDQQQKIAEYCRHRIAQCEDEQRIIRAFEEEHILYPDRLISALKNVVEEIEQTQNDTDTRERNVWYLCPSLFWRDIAAIMRNEALDLPKELLQIPPYLAKIERQEREEQKRRQEEQQLQESKRMQAFYREKEAERRAQKQAEICEQLGISPKALAKLQES